MRSIVQGGTRSERQKSWEMGKISLKVLRDWYRYKSRSKKISNKRDIYRFPQGRWTDGERQGLAIVAIVKDEEAYLQEWIEFHAMLGCRAFFIYDNGSTDGTAALLENKSWSVPVKRIDWRGFDGIRGTQQFAYSHALANYGPDYRWMAFIDVDEFLFPLQDDTLLQTLDHMSDLPGITLPWYNFGPDGHDAKPEGLVIENYCERAALPYAESQSALLRFKSVVDPAKVVYGGTHTFGYEGKEGLVYNERGDEYPLWKMRDQDFVVSEKLRLNHYFTRSMSELRAKLEKGRVSKAGSLDMSAYDRRMQQYEIKLERDEKILRFVPELKRRMES